MSGKKENIGLLAAFPLSVEMPANNTKEVSKGNDSQQILQSI